MTLSGGGALTWRVASRRPLTSCHRPPPLPCTPRHHGLLTNERGRAGPYVQGHREETGSSCLLCTRVSEADRCSAQRQMQDFLRMYSNLVERCFNACCNDFTSKALSSKEVRPLRPWGASRSLTARTIASQEQCVMNCTDKFLKHSERVGARFAEQNAGGW